MLVSSRILDLRFQVIEDNGFIYECIYNASHKFAIKSLFVHFNYQSQPLSVNQFSTFVIVPAASNRQQVYRVEITRFSIFLFFPFLFCRHETRRH